MDEIIIVEYNPVWPLLFQEEVTRIRRVLDKNIITRIEHLGSTAVPGLAAKPIIDLLIGARSLSRTTISMIFFSPPTTSVKSSLSTN
jgi:GrpB-like predicted nucleotidyltransferase (UPF0157 family)